ncbi:hypothetical protein MNBD_NITROSPINAE04-776 [hydrothermal vent metagenome]|uniref:Flagellar basal body rod protein N-terminal domain-containing protein n=1 Tax=hydrothermal vent metagenome TaxID=652676 RepID=A0A3B1BC49_9ZZZZ
MADIYKIREIGLLEQGLNMRLARQTAIMANVANVSTPGYKAVEVEFKNRLQSATGQRLGMAETNPGHLPNKMRGVAGVSPDYKVSIDRTRLDDNNVDLDKEFSKSAANTIEYSTLIAVTAKHLKTLFSVFEGGQGQ